MTMPRPHTADITHAKTQPPPLDDSQPATHNHQPQPHVTTAHNAPTMVHNNFAANYFASRKPTTWAFSSFLAEFSHKHPAVRLDEAKSRFLNALQKIVASPSSPSARDKAQSLIDTLKNRSSKKRPQQSDNLVIHGDISIAPGGQIINTRGDDAPGGQIINTGGSNVSIAGKRGVSVEGEGLAKRRRREPTPTLHEDEQDEEGSDGEEGNVDKEGNNEEIDEDDNGNDGPSTAVTQPYNHQLHDFRVAFSVMRNKRVFTSGRILEDIIHTQVTQDPPSAGGAISWIVDPSDYTVKTWFKNEDLKELLGWVPPTPKADEYFIYAKKRYNNKSTILDLREVAESKPTPPGVRYDRKSNFNATYVNDAAGAILSMIEQSSTNETFGPSGHKEGWYGSKLWSTVLDHCLDDLDNFTVSRTEIRSKSGCPKKRFDAIFLGLAGVEIAEFGAVETARTSDVLALGKRACDEGKLRDVMAAMLKALLSHVDHDAEAAKLLQVVGVQQVGFNIRISTMCSISEGVFLLKRGNWRKVPNKLENFRSVFDVLESVVVMKNIIQRSVETIQQYFDKKAELAGEFEL